MPLAYIATSPFYVWPPSHFNTAVTNSAGFLKIAARGEGWGNGA